MSSTQKPIGSTDNKQPTPTAQNSGMTRRDLLRRSAVGGATLAGVSTGAIRLDHGPVRESQAIAPAVAAAGVGGSMAVGWALRETEIIGSDDPPEGLTADALENEAYMTARTRKSTNASTIVDNNNIIDGIEHSAYADGKIAAIDKLNDQETESEVLDAAHEALDEYVTTIQENLLKTWDEGATEFKNFHDTLDDHPDTSSTSVFDPQLDDYNFTTETVTLADGSEIEVTRPRNSVDGGSNRSWGPTGTSQSPDNPRVTVSWDGNTFDYLDYDEWNPVWSDLMDVYESVEEGLTTYVENIYSDVQSGELETAELLTPREQAELTSNDEDFPQAIADLQALNVSVDLEREAEIYLKDVEATVYGQLAYTGDTTLETGTVDPDSKVGTIYFTYDISQGEGEWSAYEEGIDGGLLTFTSEPFEETLYIVETTGGETVEITDEDFDEDDDEEEWIADLSDDLDDAITSVEQIQFFSEVSETQYETIQLVEEFEIVTYSDSDGNEYDKSNFERSEPQSDDNYISEEEWQEQQERNEELIQKYEEAQDSGISIPGVDDVLDGEANGLIGIAVVGMVLVSAILSALNPLS